MDATQSSAGEIKPEFHPQVELQRWLRINTPPEIYLKLKGKVLGQDEELRKAAILIYGFIKAMIESRNDMKFHFIVEGRSGCGKTTFARALHEILPCPVLEMDASQLTPAGYKGAEASDFVNSEELEKWWGCGVVVLDELDKLMEASNGSDKNFHRQALENLLKMLDGGMVVGQKGESIDCKRILFIGLGAFSHLETETQTGKRPIGFAANEATEVKSKNLSKEVMTEACGSEQFLGRFTTVLHFKPLGREMYRRIIDQTVREIADLYGHFVLPYGAEEKILDQAMSSDFGCRSIKSAVMETFLNANALISQEMLDAVALLDNRLEASGEFCFA